MSSAFVAPGQQRNLRACMVCSIVQLQSRFMREGCPNCEDILALQGSSEAIEECTSQVFEGLVTLADPAQSWVARWQRLDKYVGGVYAVKVMGTLPEDARQRLEDAGKPYRPYAPVVLVRPTCRYRRLTSGTPRRDGTEEEDE